MLTLDEHKPHPGGETYSLRITPREGRQWLLSAGFVEEELRQIVMIGADLLGLSVFDNLPEAS